MSSLGGLLFSATVNTDTTNAGGGAGGSHQGSGNGMLVAPSGTLDLPNLYCNTNASVCVSMTGEPLRPDDELLKLSLEHCHPSELFTSVGEERSASETKNTLLHTMIHVLADMLDVLTTNSHAKSSHVSAAGKAISASPFKRAESTRSASENGNINKTTTSRSMSVDSVDPELESLFPEQLLVSTFHSSEVKELDAVAVLEWICHIVFSSKHNLREYWSQMHGE